MTSSSPPMAASGSPISHSRVIAPDLCGAAISGHPYAEKSYTSPLMTDDLVGGLDALSVDPAFVHGEDRGAEYGYVLAARHPGRVHALAFAETILSGFVLEERSVPTGETVNDAATLENAKVNRELSVSPLSIPVMATGASQFFGDLVRQSLAKVGQTVSRHEILERCGHSLAPEQPEKLAALLVEFLGTSAE